MRESHRVTLSSALSIGYFQENSPDSGLTNKSSSCSPHDEPSQPVAGVIGAAFSGVSIMVANILKLFKVSYHMFFIFKKYWDDVRSFYFQQIQIKKLKF